MPLSSNVHLRPWPPWDTPLHFLLTSESRVYVGLSSPLDHERCLQSKETSKPLQIGGLHLQREGTHLLPVLG